MLTFQGNDNGLHLTLFPDNSSDQSQYFTAKNSNDVINQS